jgi:hypothetical protein
LVWFGLVWFGLVWFGLVWFGLVWFGLVWFGLICRAGGSMSNLAATYSDLGRYSDALAMEEQVLEFRRRVLPANHPDIGEGCAWRDGLHAV